MRVARCQPGPPPTKPPAKKLCKCTFEYDAGNDDELTLKVGDIITILNQEEEGWWEGELNGKQGVFPNNFVEELSAEEAAAAAPAATPSAADPDEEDLTVKAKKVQRVGLGNIFGEGGMPTLKKATPRPTAAAPAAKPAPAAPAVVLKPPSARGGAPPPKPAAAKPQPAAVPSPTAAPKKASRPPPPADAPPQVRATFDYDPVNPDELELKVGALVKVLKKEDGGWWEGECNGKTGWFPDNFVEEVPAEQAAPPPKASAPAVSLCRLLACTTARPALLLHLPTRPGATRLCALSPGCLTRHAAPRPSKEGSPASRKAGCGTGAGAGAGAAGGTGTRERAGAGACSGTTQAG